MKLRPIALSFLMVATAISCHTKTEKKAENKSEPAVEFIEHETCKEIDVMIDNKLFTSLKWPENVYRPVLHPIRTASGTVITRGFPLEPRPGERPDHRHHVGNWFNYGNVNGFDFWGNGHTGERSINGGEIKLLNIEKLHPGEGVIITNASWIDPEGNELLTEKTEYHFIARDTTRIIDRIVTLSAKDDTVFFNDTKEGMFAVRVARQLELPSKGDVTLLDAQGNPTKVSAMSNEGISGNYRSSEGVTGSAVWGTRARWMSLSGNIGDEKISLAICDHPANPNHPTYWHARGYGLFSANPLGVKDFTKGEERLNFSLPPGQTVTFRYRLVISSGIHLTDEAINAFAEDFTAKYE